jgi:elongation factor G
MAVRPTSKAGVDKLGPSLQRLIEEDPGLRLSRDASSGEVIISGLGDAHLDVTIERLRRKFNIDVELSVPTVPYRETVAKTASADYTHKKQTGGHGQYARVALEVNPLPRGSGLQFTQRVVGGSVPKEFIPAVEKGVNETSAHGAFAGFELTDCQVVLLDGKHHAVDSSEMSFKLAASQALKEAVNSAQPTLLEPVMNIKVFAPEANAGDVVSDLNTKRAKIHGINPDGGMSVIEAEVRSRRCSVTPQTCAPSPRAGAPSSWSSTTTARSRRISRRRLLRSTAGARRLTLISPVTPSDAPAAVADGQRRSGSLARLARWLPRGAVPHAHSHPFR